MTPQDFIAKWGPNGPAFDLNERQGAQSYFLDLCELLDVPKPASEHGTDYAFEKQATLIGEARGYADVFKRGAFAWENKKPSENLDKALKQLLNYSLALSNPPLLVVCNRLTIRIHTQFNGHPSTVHTVDLGMLAYPENRALLRRLWTDVESFRPRITSRDITEQAAQSFATLADGLRKRAHHPDKVAHFLTQCLFCFFAEDVGLLPDRMFERLVGNRHLDSTRLTQGLQNLFTTMGSGGLFGAEGIPRFNGGLFLKVDVPKLEILDITELRNAARLNWSAIDVSIFGTLFERGLDPAKRSQLGAHYTDTATIERIIEPVLRRPLLQKWKLLEAAISGHLAQSTKKKSPRVKLPGQRTKEASPGDKAYQKGESLFRQWLDELNDYRVLDPACGSGNFLFLGLKALKDIEHQSHLEAAALGLDREADLVTGPHNVLGIELNEYAAELARVTVWIGELQWRMAHGYEFKTNPVLVPLEHIECRDALLQVRPESASPARSEASPARPESSSTRVESSSVRPDFSSVRPDSPPVRPEPPVLSKVEGVEGVEGLKFEEAPWPRASIVIGNPPFLGGSKKRGELGDAYFEALKTVFAGRVAGGADLVTYWFDKARKHIKEQGLGAAGLVATQAIRAGSNRKVLEAIVQETRIFDAWADEEWVNEGAAVRVSLVSFGWGDCCFLNGQRVERVTAELGGSSSLDITLARPQPENRNTSFEGTKKYGDFDIPGQLARQWLLQPNPHGLSNALVVKPWRNGQDITRRASDTWIIDFGTSMPEADACLFELPFGHVVQNVKPERLKVRRTRTLRLWWLHEEARVALRLALEKLPRFITTSRVAKHRFFSFLDKTVLPDSRLNAIARCDDTTFGILSSRIHEVWSLETCSWIGAGNDPIYNAKSCFETFPFPTGLTPADTAHQRTQVLPSGAQIPDFFAAQTTDESKKYLSKNNSINKSKDIPSMISTKFAILNKSLKLNNVNILNNKEKTNVQNIDKTSLEHSASRIAEAAHRLNLLREAWLNPPEWTQTVPEVVPLGLAHSPYPDRILPQLGLSEADAKALGQRTLTNLYNQRPAWLQSAHAALDQAVATAYGWADYTAALPNEEILARLLALNLARAGAN